MALRRLTRRGFLKRAAGCALGAPYVAAARAEGAEADLPPSDRVVMGCIGVGQRGTYNMRGLMHHGAQVVAVCDADAGARARAKKVVEDHYARYGPARGRPAPGGCSVYRDYRELLARQDVDAVQVATPDHWHVPIAAAAVRAGKDIYVEKPLGVSVAEGRALRDLVRRHDAVFLHGTEQRSMGQFRLACELVRNRRIGELTGVKVACPGGQQVPDPAPAPVPDGLDWDLWLGPAPAAPYSAARCRPGGWYFISDYAFSGYVAGWGIHHMDIVQWALDADGSGPVEVRGRAVFPREGLADTPLTWSIDYVYGNGTRVSFTDNGANRQGVRFEGTQGWIHVTRGSIEASSPSLLRSPLAPGDVRLYRSDNDDRNFIECVRSRRETACPVEVAHRSTTVCYLGHIALLLGRDLRWDPVAERFLHDDDANRLLSRAMREPWHV